LNIEYAERIKRLPPYLFAELERLTAEKKKQGVDVISLGIGDPDLPAPKFVLEALAREALNAGNHNYPSSQGEKDFREAVARWYKIRFGVELNSDTQICNLIGSKEGIANVARAFVNAGDKVLVPDPAYTVYQYGATVLCDGIPVAVPLLEEKNFLPDLDSVKKEELHKARMFYLNYPNNPTGAVADETFLQEAVDFCLENNLIFCYDNPYSEFTFDGFIAPSALEAKGAMDCTIEFHSCSKTFCMTGDRIGMAVGNDKIVGGLKKIKSNIDSGAPVYAQKAAVVALDSYKSRKRPAEVEKCMREYQERRNVLVEGLNGIGLECRKPKATFYLWVRVNGDSMEFTKKVLEQGVVITPGTGFGKQGEGFVRFALTQPKERIAEAVERIAKVV
jgi:LL-diaminopimelate aminotransferase